MIARESRPGQEAAVPRTHNGHIVPNTPENSHTDAPPLPSMSPRARAIWFEAFEVGRTEGWCAGYADAESDFAELHRRAFTVVQAAARRDDFATLSERRGEHERAARHRALLAERGI